MRVFKLADLDIDPSRGELRRQDRPIPVETRVAGLIFLLVESDGVLVTHEQIYDRLWPGLRVSRDSLYRVIKEARATLGDDGRRQAVIKTVPGQGVRWVAPLEISEHAGPGVGFASLESIEENYAAGRIDVAREQARALAGAISGPATAQRRARALVRAADVLLHGRVDREWSGWATETLDDLAPDERSLRGALLARLAYQLYWSRDPERARQRAREAYEHAEASDDLETLSFLAQVDHMLASGSASHEEQVGHARRSVEYAVRANAPHLEMWAREQIAHHAMEVGDVGAVEAEADAIELLAETRPLTWSARVRVMLSIHLGDFPAADRALTRQIQALSESGPVVFQYVGAPLLWLRHEQRRLGEVLPLLRHFVPEVGDVPVWRAVLARAEWEAGDRQAAKLEYEGLASGGFRGVLGNVFSPTTVAHLAELCLVLRDDARAAWFAEQLAPLAGRILVAPRANFSLGPVDLLRGRLAGAQGRDEEAIELLTRGLELAVTSRSRPAQARAHAALAQQLSGDRAGTHAASAREILEALGSTTAG